MSQVDNIFSALVNSLPSGSSAIPKVNRTMTIVPKVDIGWDKIKAPNITHTQKPLEEWNKHDLRGYVNNEFFKKVGCSWPGTRAIPAIMAIFAELECKLSARLQQDCKISTIKEYIDYFYDKHLMETIKRYKVTYNTLSYDCFVNDYVEYAKKQKTLSEIKVAPTITMSLSISDLEKASKIGKPFLLSEYGVAISYQYLTTLYTEDQARNFVIDALKRNKASGDIQIVIDSTKKYQYPEWFNLQVVNEMLESSGIAKLNLQVSTTDQFNFLRSNK